MAYPVSVDDLIAWADGDAIFLPYVEWLTQADPDDWHRSAMSWNWEAGYAVLYWIVSQPECDRATAWMIQNLTDFSFFEKYDFDPVKIPAWTRESFDFTVFIRNALRSGFYTRSEIAFDGWNVDGTERIAFAGREITCEGFAEGVPRHIRLIG